MTYFAANLPSDKHCFFGAEGGVSNGIYKGLNVNTRSDDNPEDVARNLEIAANRLGVHSENLHLLIQGVSSRVEFVEQASHRQMEADGGVTNKEGVVLCIRTADCAPVLLADYENGVIGAAHAGWRGAFGGVIENTLDLMIAKGAVLGNIRAAVGPCIGQQSYEVDDCFRQQFTGRDAAFEKYFINSANAGHYMFDLERFCGDRLKDCGVASITVSGLDTYALENDYYSFRRYTHRGLIKAPKCFPVELSAIKL